MGIGGLVQQTVPKRSTEPRPALAFSRKPNQYTEEIRSTDFGFRGNQRTGSAYRNGSVCQTSRPSNTPTQSDPKVAQSGIDNRSQHSQPKHTNHIPKWRSRDDLWFGTRTTKILWTDHMKSLVKTQGQYSRHYSSVNGPKAQVTPHKPKNYMQYTKIKI